MSAPYFSYNSFEVCSDCKDEEDCWAKDACKHEEAINAYANAMVKQDQLRGPSTVYPGPYHPGDSMPDGRNMASTEKERTKE